MNWQRAFIAGCLLFGSVAVWGQAAAEYGITASKTAATAAAVAKSLSRQTSATISAAANLDVRTNRHSVTATPRSPQARPIHRPAPHRPVQAATTPVPATTTSNTGLATISVQGGVVGKRQPDPKYAGVVQIAPSRQEPTKHK